MDSVHWGVSAARAMPNSGRVYMYILRSEKDRSIQHGLQILYYVYVAYIFWVKEGLRTYVVPAGAFVCT